MAKLVIASHDGEILAEGLGVVLDVSEIGLDLISLGSANADELIENPVGEIDLAASIAQGSRDERGKAAHQQQHEDQL